MYQREITARQVETKRPTIQAPTQLEKVKEKPPKAKDTGPYAPGSDAEIEYLLEYKPARCVYDGARIGGW